MTDDHQDDTKALWDASQGFHFRLHMMFPHHDAVALKVTVGETQEEEHRTGGTLLMPKDVARTLYHLIKAGCAATGHKSGVELVEEA